MGMTAFISGLREVASGAFEFAKTWVGGVVIAFAIAWFWSGWRHDAACATREKAARAAAEAAVEAQLIEWKTAAEDIARDATARVEEDARAARAQTVFISNLTGKESSHARGAKDLATDFVDRPLFLDRDYIAVVRAFDAAGDRGADPFSIAITLPSCARSTRPEIVAPTLPDPPRNFGKPVPLPEPTAAQR